MDFGGYIVQASVVDGEFFVRQLPIRSLEHVVNALGDVEETGVFGTDHGPLRRDPKRVAERHQGVKKLSDTTTIGGAVDVDYFAVSKPVGNRSEFGSGFGWKQFEVVVRVCSRIINYVNQSSPCLR